MTAMATAALQAIDVHAHYGDYFRPNFTKLENSFMGGSAAEVVRRAEQAQTKWTVVSPLKALLPRGEADAAEGNREAADIVPRTPGLLQWGVVHPLQSERCE